MCDKDGCPANDAKARTLVLWDRMHKPFDTMRERKGVVRQWKAAAAAWCSANKACWDNAVDWRTRCLDAESIIQKTGLKK